MKKIVILIFLVSLVLSLSADQTTTGNENKHSLKPSKFNSVKTNLRQQESFSKKLPSKNSDYPADIKKIVDRNKIIAGILADDKPPFIMTGKNGELYGVDISLSKDIAKCLGIEIEFNRKAKSYPELLELAACGEVDFIISKISRTFDRAKKVRFTKPYIIFRQALLLNKVYAVKNKIEEYPVTHLRSAKVKIGARLKTSYVDYAKEMFKNAEIIEGEWDEIVKKAIKGSIIAVMRDEYEILKLLKKNPDYALYLSVYVLKDKLDHISIAVPSSSSHLESWLNLYLETNEYKKNATDIINEYPEVFGMKE